MLKINNSAEFVCLRSTMQPSVWFTFALLQKSDRTLWNSCALALARE